MTGRPRRRGGGIPIVRPPIRVTDQTATDAFDRRVAAAMARSVDRAPPPVAFVGVDVAALGLQLLERLDPRRSVGRRVVAMVVAPQPVDPFAGIMAFPILPEATYRYLDELGGGWMLPAADGLEPDTAILLQTNPGFTAAFLVGMNHEMNGELLWRGYPTDQRGTPFQRFWDRDRRRHRHRAGPPVAARSAAGHGRCTAAAVAGGGCDQRADRAAAAWTAAAPLPGHGRVRREGHACRSPARRSSGRAARCSPGGCSRT